MLDFQNILLRTSKLSKIRKLFSLLTLLNTYSQPMLMNTNANATLYNTICIRVTYVTPYWILQTNFYLTFVVIYLINLTSTHQQLKSIIQTYMRL